MLNQIVMNRVSKMNLTTLKYFISVASLGGQSPK